MKEWFSRNKLKLLYIFLLLQPFIDLITSITTRFEIGIISLGVIVRGLFILVMLIYLLFYCNTKYKKVSIFFVFLLGFYVLGYFLVKPELIMNKSFLVTEIIYLFKYLYFLVLLVTMFNFYKQYKPDLEKIIKIFVFDLLVFSLFIIIPYFTETGFQSYVKNRGKGVIGWFYAANDISVVFVMLFSLVHLITSKKYDFRKYLIYIPIVFTICLIGTKSAYFGMMISFILLLIYYLIQLKKNYKHFITILAFVSLTVVITPYLPVYKNISKRINVYTESEEKKVSSDFKGNKNDQEENKIVKHEDDTMASLVIFSSRDKLLVRTKNIYDSRDFKEKMLGIGFSNRESINNSKIEKLVEMDLFDIWFHCGIVLLVIYLIILVPMLLYFLYYLLKNKFILSLVDYVCGFSIVIGIFVGAVAGHVFSSPAVSIYLVFLMIMFIDKISNSKTMKKIK